MLYIFWLTLYRKYCNVDKILYQYNISKNEYDEFQKEKIEKINHQLEYYISNRRMSRGLFSSDLFEKFKENSHLQKFVSKNMSEFYKFIDIIVDNNEKSLFG